MKRYLLFFSAVLCASAAIAQIPDTSPQDLSGANTAGAVTTDTGSQTPGTTQAPAIQAPNAPSSSGMQSGVSPVISPSGQGNNANAAVAEPSSAGSGGTSSRPVGGYWLGGGNVFSATSEEAPSGGTPAASNGDASSGTPPANSDAAANRSAGDSRAASSTASGQDASTGNTASTAKPRPNIEDCRAYARHQGVAAQGDGQAPSSSGQAADPCAGLDQNTAR